ncbi:MAG: hypothetical protein Q4G05_06170 [Clostridia bacterium]|nr:hypothetical protein [Clostridia bacterium]
MNKKEIIRRSISIPKDIDDKISIMVSKYSYTVKNDLIVELIELGIIKYEEDIELKNKINTLMVKVEELLNNIESK